MAFATGSYARRSTKWDKPEIQVMAKVLSRKSMKDHPVISIQFPIISKTINVIQWLKHQGQWISSSSLWWTAETHSLTSLKIEVVVTVNDIELTQRAKIRSDSIFILDHFVVWTEVWNTVSVLKRRIIRYSSLNTYVWASTSAARFVLKGNLASYRSCLNFLKFLFNRSIWGWWWRGWPLLDLSLTVHDFCIIGFDCLLLFRLNEGGHRWLTPFFYLLLGDGEETPESQNLQWSWS